MAIHIFHSKPKVFSEVFIQADFEFIYGLEFWKKTLLGDQFEFLVLERKLSF